MISEPEVAAGIAIVANELGLSSTAQINVQVVDADNSFSAQYGSTGLQSFAYGNSQVSVFSKDQIYIYGGLLILIGLFFGTILNAKK